MSDTFDERMTLLRELVGKGITEGEVEVNQVYAHYQDSGEGPNGKPAATFEHPRGGIAGYLSDTLTGMGPEVAQRWADSISEERPMTAATIESVDELVEDVHTLAPREFWLLRNSASGKVSDDGRVVFDKPALMPRATQMELDEIRRLSGEDIVHEEERQHTTEFQPGFTTRGQSISSILRRTRART